MYIFYIFVCIIKINIMDGVESKPVMNTYFDKAYAEPNEKPSMKNIYKSNHWQEVRADEQLSLIHI